MQSSLQPCQSSDTLVLPLLGSVVLHLVLVLALLFFYENKPLPTDSGIETMLISADDLAQIEGQLKNYAIQSQKIGEQNTKTIKKIATPTNQVQPSPQMQAYHDDLSQKEAIYQKQLAEFNAKLDAEAQADIDAFEQAQIEADKRREQDVQALRETAAKQHEREQENQEALAAAKAQNEQRNAERERERNASGQSGHMGGDTSTGGNRGLEQGGTQATRTQSSGGAGNDNIKAALISHIRPHWNYTTPDAKQVLTARISVDSNGNVISSSISGGTPELRMSLKTAISQASPLTPIVGTNYTTLNIQFITNQK